MRVEATTHHGGGGNGGIFPPNLSQLLEERGRYY